MLPPSTSQSTPVTKLAASEHRNATTDAISSGRPSRPPSGVFATMHVGGGRVRGALGATHSRVDDAGRERDDARARGAERGGARHGEPVHAALGEAVGAAGLARERAARSRPGARARRRPSGASRIASIAGVAAAATRCPAWDAISTAAAPGRSSRRERVDADERVATRSTSKTRRASAIVGESPAVWASARSPSAPAHRARERGEMGRVAADRPRSPGLGDPLTPAERLLRGREPRSSRSWSNSVPSGASARAHAEPDARPPAPVTTTAPATEPPSPACSPCVRCGLACVAASSLGARRYHRGAPTPFQLRPHSGRKGAQEVRHLDDALLAGIAVVLILALRDRLCGGARRVRHGHARRQARRARDRERGRGRARAARCATPRAASASRSRSRSCSATCTCTPRSRSTRSR